MGNLNIDSDILKVFKQFVFDKHGKIRDVLHIEVETALKEHIEKNNK